MFCASRLLTFGFRSLKAYSFHAWLCLFIRLSDVNDHVVILEGYDHAFSYSQLNIKVDSHAKFGGLNCSQNGNACLDANVQIGHAMVGLVDPLKRSISTKLYVTDGGQEPIPPLFIKMNATVVVTGPLKVGTVYRVFRFDGVHKIPRDSNFASAGYSTVHTFRAMGATHTWQDPTPILSNSAVAYVVCCLVLVFLLSSHVHPPVLDTLIAG